MSAAQHFNTPASHPWQVKVSVSKPSKKCTKYGGVFKETLSKFFHTHEETNTII